MAQINFQILTVDRSGAPLPGTMVVASNPVIPSEDGTSPFITTGTTDATGIFSVHIDNISREGPYQFIVSAIDCISNLKAVTSISVGIGNDTNTNPPFVIILT